MAQGPDVPARYPPFSEQDIENAYDELHGIREPDEEGAEASVRAC